MAVLRLSDGRGFDADTLPIEFYKTALTIGIETMIADGRLKTEERGKPKPRYEPEPEPEIILISAT